MLAFELGQALLPQIAIDLLTGDKIKFVGAGGTDARPDQARVLEQVGEFAGVSGEVTHSAAIGQTRCEGFESFEGQGTLQSRANTGVQSWGRLFSGGHEKQRPSVSDAERSTPWAGPSAPLFNRRPLNEPAIADLGCLKLAMGSQVTDPRRRQVQGLGGLRD